MSLGLLLRSACLRHWLLTALMSIPLMVFIEVRAQDRPVRLLTGFPPGASLDTVARVLAEELKSELGRSVIVENKTGASGRIANEFLKNAQQDGNTLLLAPVATLSIFPHVFGSRLRYDPFRDFAPVAHVARFQIGFATSKKLPIETLGEYVALAKRESTVRDYSSAAVGSIPHFIGLSFAKLAGIELIHVPYRGAASSMNALIAGEISALAVATSDVASLVASGSARVLAVTGRNRSPAMPNVPTFLEAGYNIEGEGAYALFLPGGTPTEIVNRVSMAALRALKQPHVKRKLESLGLEPTGLGSVELANIVKADYEYWSPIIRASGFVLND